MVKTPQYPQPSLKSKCSMQYEAKNDYKYKKNANSTKPYIGPTGLNDAR